MYSSHTDAIATGSWGGVAGIGLSQWVMACCHCGIVAVGSGSIAGDLPLHLALGVTVI